VKDRIEHLKEDIARRIRPVMRHMPEEEFDRLIARMAELQKKYETRVRSDFLRFNGIC